MKRITTRNLEFYDPKKHVNVLAVNRKVKKSVLFVDGRLVLLPSSPDITAVDRDHFSLDDFETSGYELHNMNETEFQKFAALTLRATTEAGHIKMILDALPERPTTETTELTKA